jgi:RimJ/RimL family protein N-acetyltransferase
MTDVGWRSKRSVWEKRYATEGAKICLAYAFDVLNIDQVIAVCTITNKESENAIKKLGMTKQGEFNHSKLVAEHPDGSLFVTGYRNNSDSPQLWKSYICFQPIH